MADDYLAAQVPAYGAVRSACGAIPECVEGLADLRNEVVEDVARVTGVWGVVAALVATWQKLPRPLRDAAAAAGEIVGDVKTAFDDTVSTLKQIYTDPDAIWDLVEGGFVEAGLFNYNYGLPGTDLVRDMYNSGLDAILGPIEDVPILGPIATGTKDLAVTAMNIFVDPIGTIEDIGEFLGFGGGREPIRVNGKTWAEMTHQERLHMCSMWEPEGGYYGPNGERGLHYRWVEIQTFDGKKWVKTPTTAALVILLCKHEPLIGPDANQGAFAVRYAHEITNFTGNRVRDQEPGLLARGEPEPPGTDKSWSDLFASLGYNVTVA